MTRIICWPSQYPPWVAFVWLDYTRGISIGIFSIFHNALDLNRSKRKCNATLKRVLTKTHTSTPYNNSHLYCWPFPLFIASAAVLSWSPDIILSCGAACTCSMPRGKHFFFFFTHSTTESLSLPCVSDRVSYDSVYRDRERLVGKKRKKYWGGKKG